MKDIKELNVQKIRGFFFDIDDTFTTDGVITAEAFGALWDLKDAGLVVVPITGRPAGWCDHIARMWPVTAVIGENGAFYFMMKDGVLTKNYIWGEKSLEDSRKKLEEIKKKVFEKYPQAGLASDQNYREFDLAIDFCEDVAPLSNEEIDGIVAIFEKHGARTKISSIHVNGWFGDYDKLSATKIFVRDELGLDLDQENEKFIFCGDSPNDEPMFKFFQNSVAVSNILKFKDRVKDLPAYITPSPSGAGFVELVREILTNRE